MKLNDLAKKLFPSTIDAEPEFEEYDETEGNAEGMQQYEEPRTAPVYSSNENVYAPSGARVVGGSSIEMKVVTPKSYDSVAQIADLLRAKKTVLLNLENTNRETARRLIDFLSGAAYALGGGVQKVADNTYAVTPSNVAVTREGVGAMQTQSQQASSEEVQNNTVSY